MKLLVIFTLIFISKGSWAKTNECVELKKTIQKIPIDFHQKLMLANTTYLHCLFSGVDEKKFQTMVSGQWTLKNEVEIFLADYSKNTSLYKKCLKGKFTDIPDILKEKSNELQQLSILPFLACTHEGRKLIQSQKPLNAEVYREYYEKYKKTVDHPN